MGKKKRPTFFQTIIVQVLSETCVIGVTLIAPHNSVRRVILFLVVYLPSVSVLIVWWKRRG